MKKAIYFLPAFLWFVLIFILLIIPGKNLPEVTFLDKIYFDKWVHITLFAVQVYLSYTALKKIYPLSSAVFLNAAIYAWLYGIAMEFVQKYWVPNRSFDVTDIIADGVGCLIAYFIFRKKYKKAQVN